MAAHAEYLEHSPYYANLVAHYGRTLSRPIAERVAREHSVSLGDLLDEGLTDGERFDTLELLQVLGY